MALIIRELQADLPGAGQVDHWMRIEFQGAFMNMMAVDIRREVSLTCSVNIIEGQVNQTHTVDL